VCFVQTNDLLTLWSAFDYGPWVYYAAVDFISSHTDQKLTVNWSDGRTEEIPADHLLNLPDTVVKPREHDLLSPIRIESEGRGGMFVVEYAGLF
jgi:hypothetical protein